MTIEKTIAAALEPIADAQIALEKSIAELKRVQDAPFNYEINLDDVADTLKGSTEFLDLVKGAPGKDGRDGNDGENIKGDPGNDGRDGAGFNVPIWEPGIYRKDAIVQHDLGRISMALVDTAQAPGGNDWQRVGASGFRWCGVKQDDYQYSEGDLYIDNGTTFLWSRGKSSMFSKRGKDGTNGTNGRNGTDAPRIINAQILDDCKTLGLVFSDGAVIDCDLPQGFTDAIKSVNAITDLRHEIQTLKTALEELKGARDGD